MNKFSISMQELFVDRTRRSLFRGTRQIDKKSRERESSLYKFTLFIVNRTAYDKLESAKFVIVFRSRLLKESG